MTPSRRGFLGLFGGGVAAVLAAPAIVRVAALMPVKALPPVITPAEFRWVQGPLHLTVSDWEEIRRSLVDNIARNNPLLARLRAREAA